eukprot:SAG22_NODE_1_length_62449_cov_158.689270_15_plen_230_part_00
MRGAGLIDCVALVSCLLTLCSALLLRAAVNFTTFVKNRPPKPAPNLAGGALALLKHDSMGPKGDAAIIIFNPGAAQTVTVDLSMLPPSVFGSVPMNLFGGGATPAKDGTAPPPLAKSWAVEMKAGEFAAFSGFSLGVFAPRRGKKAACKPADGHNKPAAADTLQGCFLECAKDKRCENVLLQYMDVVWLEKPPAAKCTLLGAVKDPSTGCTAGNGTLVAKLSARQAASA